LLASTAAAQTGVIRLAAIADAHVDQSQPSTNFGSDVELNFGKVSGMPSSYFLRGHILFDLTPFLSARPPDRARLRWYQHRSNSAGCLDVTLHRVTSPWGEATVDWNTKPTHDTVVAGRACVGDSFDLGWKLFDVTMLVRDWVTSTHPNLGMVIRDPSESPAGAPRPGYGHSRESTQTALRPVLEISWGTVSFGTGCGNTRTIPTLDLADGSPMIGGNYTLAGVNLARISPALHFVGTSNTNWAGVPLPFSLAGLGFPNCTLLVSGQIVLTGTTGTNGQVSTRFDIPNDASLRGASIHHQITAIESGPSLSMTNAFTMTLF
jgi:hypothetical protein